jgi:hypothetical protein
VSQIRIEQSSLPEANLASSSDTAKQFISFLEKERTISDSIFLFLWSIVGIVAHLCPLNTPCSLSLTSLFESCNFYFCSQIDSQPNYKKNIKKTSSQLTIDFIDTLITAPVEVEIYKLFSMWSIMQYVGTELNAKLQIKLPVIKLQILKNLNIRWNGKNDGRTPLFTLQLKSTDTETTLSDISDA